jgi:hypothetical protein
MKTTAALLFIAAQQLCFARGDTNLIAMSDWSNPVGNEFENQLRVRTIITYGRSPGFSGPLPETQFYLEFENTAWPAFATEFYFDPEQGLHCEVRDANGKLLAPGGGGSGPGGNRASWIVLPRASTIRLHAGDYGYGQKPGEGLRLCLWRSSGQDWLIAARDTNTYFLSGTFSLKAPTNFVAKFHEGRNAVCTGTFRLPAVKIYPEH